jgi:hypothetical protein
MSVHLPLWGLHYSQARDINLYSASGPIAYGDATYIVDGNFEGGFNA